MVHTNEKRTYKGQITFFQKNLLGTNKGQIFRKIFYEDFLFRLTIFGQKLSLLIFWCEGLRSFLKRTFSSQGKPDVIR